MSFSKAKIQRFNDLPSEAPPPGAYDPKFNSKVKSFVIEKTERFQDGKSVMSSGGECNLSVSSKGNGPVPSPKFRTPQLPKKRLVTKPTNTSCPKAKTKLVLGSSKNLKYDVRDELADLKVECENKDKTIQDHARQIEEMKKETWKLEKELVELQAKQVEIEEQHKKDLESMAKLQQEIQDSRDRKHVAEVEQLRSQLMEITETREQESLSRKDIEKGIEVRFVETSEKSVILEEEIKRMEINAQSELARMKDKLTEIKDGKEFEIKSLFGIVAEKENKLTEVRTEYHQLKFISDELRDALSRLEDDRENEIFLLKNEEETLRAEVDESRQVRNDLESKLETRQQVVLQLQSQLSTLQCEVDELRAECERLVAESEMKTKDLIDRHDRELFDTRHEFVKERECLQRDKDAETARKLELECENKKQTEINAFLTEELRNVQKLYKDANQRLIEAQEMLETTRKKHSEELEAMKSHHNAERSKLEELLEKTRLEYIRELDNMTEARNNELEEVKAAAERTIEEHKRRVKERTDKIIENAETATLEILAACRTESDERIKRIISKSDTKLRDTNMKDMVRDARNAVEKETREAADRYATCLVRIEAEKALLEEKLAQRDAEIVKLSVTLDELKIVVENQESFSQSLQSDLDRVEAELAERKDELRALKDQILSEAAEMVTRRRRFEVVMAENQATVAALSQRLYESDAQVERLQKELKTGEDSIQEHRGLLIAMRDTSNILNEKLYALMKQLDENKSRVDQLETGNLAEIERLRSIFYAEIENLKLVSAKEMTRLEEECKRKDQRNEELKNHLDAMASKLNETRDILLRFEELEDTRGIEISQLELDKEKLVQELKLKNKVENNVLFGARETKRKLTTDKADQQVALLTEKIGILESEKTDVEKLQVEREHEENKQKEEIHCQRVAEEELKKLTDDNEVLRKSYREVSDKYAEMIGHENHKQRVKHLNQLKDKIIRLEKDVEMKKHVIEQQTKTIEKLKAEDKRSLSKGKENLHGISRSPYVTPVSSPLKPLTPLRERNE